MVRHHDVCLNMYVGQSGATESAQLDRGVSDDLRQARVKTATGNLAYVLSPACEPGKVRNVQGLLGLRKRYSDRQVELACERCGIIDMITAKALMHVIKQMELEARAGIPLGSGADDASTPAYEGRGVHARDPRVMTQ